jgi:lipopolysaccharide export system permease protein
MIKKLDKYILKQFLGTFFYSIILICFIIIIFDISERIEDFIEFKAPLKEIAFDYYLTLLPFYINTFSPLFTFISVIYFTSRLASKTEFVSMLNAGISYNRLMWPYFIGAAVITIISLISANFIIPQAMKTNVKFEDKYLHHKYVTGERNIHYQILKGTYIYFESYNNDENTGYKFSVEKRDGNRMSYKAGADRIVWDSLKSKWKMYNYYERKIAKDGKEILKMGEVKDTTINFHPSDMGRRDNKMPTLNYFEIKEFIEYEKLRGSDLLTLYELEHYKRFSIPFATFILTMLGVSISSRKVRGGIGIHLGLGLGLAFTYIMALQVTNTIALANLMKPLPAVWIPNIIFAVIALFIYSRAQK